jgi:hypothetical protein
VSRFVEGLTAETPTAGTIQTSTGETLQGQAVDGKVLRGTRAHGPAPHLVSLVRHGSGMVLAETAVAEKSNEIMAVPRLFRRHGWANIAAAFRYYGASVRRVLELIGALPARL